MTIARTYRFSEVFQEEVEAINLRRRELGRTDLVQLEIEVTAASTSSTEPNSKQDIEANSLSSAESTTRAQDGLLERESVLRPTTTSNLVGLAL